uniref:Uncharacterized protein n=1 Tax=Rhizophora mucronata TaxID=61149 RepID=A0A2P2MC22_RHIMU
MGRNSFLFSSIPCWSSFQLVCSLLICYWIVREISGQIWPLPCRRVLFSCEICAPNKKCVS